MPPPAALVRGAVCVVLPVLLVLGAGGIAPESVTVTILETSDVHGRLLPWDFLRSRSADVGLARVATRVARIRAETPYVLLVDGGDTIEGTPEEALHARRAAFAALLASEGAPDVDPMARAMSLMGYDAMAVGNHDFYFGLDVLRKAEKESSFPWLSARRRPTSSSGTGEYRIKGTDRALSITALAKKHPGKLDLDYKERPKVPSTFPNGCHVEEVEIEPETGDAEIVSYVAVDDAGTIVNHQIVEGQMQGVITQGAGHIFGEQAV